MHFFRLVASLFLALLPLHAHTLSGTYDVSFSIIGKIGEANVYLDLDNDTYHIHADGYLLGFAASMASNRRESHDSYGKVVNGRYMPERYVIVREANGFYEKTEFLIDAAKQQVVRNRFKERTIVKRGFDIDAMRIIDKTHVEKKNTTKVLPYFATDDVLSLFFNVQHLLPLIPKGSEHIGHSVGTANKEGKVLIINPDDSKRKMLHKVMPDNIGRFVSVVIDQDIFESDRGELMLSLDEEYLAKEARLNDVLLFGDIHAIMTGKTGKVPDLRAPNTE